MSARLNVNINDESKVALEQAAEKEGHSITEIVRRMIAVYTFLHQDTTHVVVAQVIAPSAGQQEKLAALPVETVLRGEDGDVGEPWVVQKKAGGAWFEVTLGQVELAAARKQAWTVLYSRPEAKA